MELHKPKNLYELLTLNMEQRFANRVAFRWYDADQDVVVEKHFGEYAQDIRRAVNYYLSTIPDIQGKRVCVWSNNSYHYAVNCYGVMMAGGVIVPMNQRKSWDELHRELELVEPSAILTDGDDYGCNEEMQAAYGSLLRPMDAYKAYEPAELVNRIQPEELMVLMFTSGTTGRSKGVMLCERNFFAVMPHHVRVGQRFCQLKNDPDLLVSHMTLLPMFHLGAFGCLFTWAWMGWAQNLGSLRSFYKDLKRMPSQAMAAVPVLVQSIHHDLMTGKQGKDDGHCEIKLDNGELCMRGGNVMLGYYKDPEGTAEVVDAEGWFHTGDLARVDEDGYYFLTGRKKNVIILGSGENVSPEELEGLLEKCPAVKECLVKEKGKKICAVVCCEEADQQTVRDFITETNRTLPLYKRMSAVEFSAQPLPRNAMGKLMR